MNESLSKVVKNPVILSSVVGVVTFGAGTAVGYIFGRRTNKYEVFEPPPKVGVGVVLDKEALDEIKKRHASAPSQDDNAENDTQDGESSAREFIQQHMKEKIISMEPSEPDEDDEEEPLEEVNVFSNQTRFAGDDPNWNYEEELAKRETSQIYVIHADEYHNEESGFNQSTLTWYEGDHTLADEHDSPRYNHAEVIGGLYWGHGSNDENCFYVRNEKLRAEFEVIFNPGHYMVEAQGLVIEEDLDAQDQRQAKAPKRFSQTD